MSLLVKGITKLSELTIDDNKDWAVKGIDSLGYVIIEDGAGHYMRLPSLTTAQRDGLTPASGMTIWNSDNTRIEKYDGSDWGAMGIAGVTVRKNTMMPVIGNRPQLNLIEGASVGINIADNPPDDEIDITISAKYPTRFKVLIPDDAAEAVPGGETKAALANVVGTNFGYEALDFDPDAEEVAYWEEYLTPDYLSENIVVDIYWITTDANAAHNAVFGISVLGREKGEAWDAALGVERTVVSLNGGAGVLNKARITTFSPGWSPGDVFLLKLARKAADGSDDVDQDARVLKVVVSYTGQFAQAFYPLAEPTELTIPAAGSWQIIDVSSYLPTGATGVILHIYNAEGSANNYGLRKKGSTDNRTLFIDRESHGQAMIGVDENRKFEVYLQDIVTMHVYLIGYTATGVVFFDNAYPKTIGVDSTWADIDCSAECPGAIGIILEAVNAAVGGATARNVEVRKKGSTDTGRYSSIVNQSHTWEVIGCDGSQVIQGWASDFAVQTWYIVGYIYEGAVFKTNADDYSGEVSSSWGDVDCAGDAPSSVMLFFTAHVGSNNYGIRKKDSVADGDDTYEGNMGFHLIVACNSAHIIEARFALARLFLIGYATWAGA